VDTRGKSRIKFSQGQKHILGLIFITEQVEILY